MVRPVSRGGDGMLAAAAAGAGAGAGNKAVEAAAGRVQTGVVLVGAAMGCQRLGLVELGVA